MRISPSVVIGFGAGYLLGARAGRERYDMIMRQVRSLQDRPEVQSIAGVVSAQAGQVVRKTRQMLGGRFDSDGGGSFPGDSTDRLSANGVGTVPTP
jgi:hypothetical protein